MYWKFLNGIKDATTVHDAIVQAGLDWETAQLDMVVELFDEGIGETVPTTVKNHKCVVRTDTWGQLGVVGSRYQDIFNRDAFSMLDNVVREDLFSYTHAGEMAGGRLVVVIAELPKAILIAEHDILLGQFLMSTSHDGSNALNAKLIGTMKVRGKAVAVTNIAAFDIKRGICIRHSGNVKAKIVDARQIVGAVISSLTEFEKMAERLTKRMLPGFEVEEILELLIPDKGGAKNQRASNRRGEIRDIYEVGEGADLPSREGTAWGLFCAVASYSSAYRSVKGKEEDKEETRMRSLWFGNGDALNKKALGVLIERANMV